jgi:DNA primase
VPEVVLCFDSDEAGQNAAVRALDNLLAAGLAVRVAVVPAPHDPDSLIKASGGEAFRKLIEQAEGFFDFYLNRLCAANAVTTDKGRLAVLRDMAEAVHKTQNVVLIDKYAQKTALRLGVAPDAVRTEFRKLTPRQNGPTENAVETEESAAHQSLKTQEFCLLKLLLETEDHVRWVAEHLDLNWLTAPLVREIVSRRLKLQQSGEWQGLGSFLSSFEDAASQEIITEILTRPLVTNTDGLRLPRQQALPRPAETLQSVVTEVRNNFVDGQIAPLMSLMGNSTIPEEEQLEAARRHQTLLRLKRQPLSPAP